MVTAALINDTLSAVGAIGGLLSILGVGLLILLVASQSRQIRAMREWIEQEPQRQQETAQRVIAEVQRRIAAARERRTGVPSPDPLPPVPGAPPASAGVKPAPGTLGATPEAQAIAAQQAAATGDGPPTELQKPSFAPLTPAGAAEGGSVPPASSADDEPAIVSEILSQETQAADVLPDDDFDPAISIPAIRPRSERYGEDEFDLEEDEPRSNRLLFGVGAVALLAGIVLIATQLFGGDSTPTERTAGTPAGEAEATPTPRPSPAASVDPSSVTVRVFNGTEISGLARRATDALKAANYGVGEPQTSSSNQVQTTTIVMYRPNFKTAATQVAEELDVPTSAVQPIDANTSVAAGETAEVVVTTGADYDDGSAAGSTTG